MYKLLTGLNSVHKYSRDAQGLVAGAGQVEESRASACADRQLTASTAIYPLCCVQSQTHTTPCRLQHRKHLACPALWKAALQATQARRSLKALVEASAASEGSWAANGGVSCARAA